MSEMHWTVHCWRTGDWVPATWNPEAKTWVDGMLKTTGAWLVSQAYDYHLSASSCDEWFLVPFAPTPHGLASAQRETGSP